MGFMESRPRVCEVKPLILRCRLYRRRWLAITAALVCLALGNFTVQASDTWTGAGPNPIWTSALNWSTGAPPVVGDNVTMLGPGNTNNTANVGGALPPRTVARLH